MSKPTKYIATFCNEDTRMRTSRAGRIYRYAWRVRLGERTKYGWSATMELAERAAESAKNLFTGRINLNSRNPWCQDRYRNDAYKVKVAENEMCVQVKIVPAVRL